MRELSPGDWTAIAVWAGFVLSYLTIVWAMRWAPTIVPKGPK